jgi:hypothetical protein
MSLINRHTFNLNSNDLAKEINVLGHLSYSLLVQNVLKSYDLAGLKEALGDWISNSDSIQIESEKELQVLRALFQGYLSANDDKNLFKLFVFLIDSIFSRIFITFDELNCVQLVEFVFSLLTKLLNMKQFVLVGYCLLEIALKNLDKMVDLIEFKRAKRKTDQLPGVNMKCLVNKKLYQNTFFLSNLVKKLLDKTIGVVAALASQVSSHKALSELMVSFLGCIKSRLTHLLAKCLIRKLANFDSIVDLTFVGKSKNLHLLYANFFRTNNSSLSNKCVCSIQLIHYLSLLPLKTILANYFSRKYDGKSMLTSLQQFEVLTKKCTNNWQLHNIKKVIKSLYLGLNFILQKKKTIK